MSNSPTEVAETTNLNATPSEIVTRAAEKTRDDSLGNLLQVLADEMNDEHAVEKEYPNHIPSARWLVCGWYGSESDQDRWTYALALARQILDLPNPGAVDKTAITH